LAAVTDRQERAMSFGSIAEDYDGLRPQAPQQAVDWLVPPGCEVAVDVGAGTGLFTRALVDRAAQVIAVEPDARMRTVLTARSPGVRVVEGRGESIPLPDASADAVFVSSAWHWMDGERATPEIGRVLRDGGRFGLIWTSRDREVDWVRNLDRLPGQDTSDAESADRIRRRLHLQQGHRRVSGRPHAEAGSSTRRLGGAFPRGRHDRGAHACVVLACRPGSPRPLALADGAGAASGMSGFGNECTRTCSHCWYPGRDGVGGAERADRLSCRFC